MAYFRIEYYSNALRRTTSFEMLIPNDTRLPLVPGGPAQEEKEKPMRTLFLLHGYTGKGDNWVPYELPGKYNFAIVMPTAENSFYLNGLSTGHDFQALVGEELVNYVRKTFGLARGAEDTCIAGMSMGGYGALHTGLQYPETFGKIAALSSALIVHEIAHMKPGQDNGMGNYAYYHECFGDLETVEDRETNPEEQIRRLQAEKKKIPGIFMCCGTEDFLIENNRQMHRFLEQAKVPHQYHESAGQHDMVFWQEYIVKAVEWMFG